MSRISESTIRDVNERMDALAIVGDYVRLENRVRPVSEEKASFFKNGTDAPDRCGPDNKRLFFGEGMFVPIILEHYPLPAGRHRAEKEGLPLTGLSGSGPGGRILERDVEQALKERPRFTAAAREALCTGAVMPQAPGSGLGGRLTLEDLAAGVKSVATGTSNPGAVSPETVLKEAEKKLPKPRLRGSAKSSRIGCSVPLGKATPVPCIAAHLRYGSGKSGNG
jgi:hypothetical protein